MTDALSPDPGQPFSGGVLSHEACHRRALDSLGGDAALLAVLVPEFVRAIELQTAALESALRDADRMQVAHWAHTLKGSVLTLGATDIGAQAGAIEAQAREADFAVLSAAIEQLVVQTRHLAAQLSSA
jgi:HPt (histidine-containing phosphotransfer) domain-containing protein